MGSRSALTSHVAAAQNKQRAAPSVVVQSSQVEKAANDEKKTSAFSFRGDPLIGMAIASVIWLAVFAALMAVG